MAPPLPTDRCMLSREGERRSLSYLGTATLGGLEVRQVWSIAYRTRGPLPAELANRLLEQNGTVILGAWIIQPADGEIGVIFAVQVPADADTLAIRSAIHAVATTTDAMENELTGIDEF